jgi:uncharacterized membrane protein HdeD (DUF308 family)
MSADASIRAVGVYVPQQDFRGARAKSAPGRVRVELERAAAIHPTREVRRMSTYEATTADPLKSLWWLLILFGVIVFGVGVFFLVSPHETLETFTVIAGILLLLDGVLAIIASIVGRGEGRGLLAVIGVLSAIAGLVLIKKPFDTLVVFTLVFGIWLVVAGVVRFVSAFSEVEGRGGSIAIAVVDVIAGIVILSWPELGLTTLAVIIGIVLILRGILLMAAGWALHRVTG